MRYLLASYNFPGQLGDMAAWLGEDPENMVIFASSRQMHDFNIPGVQRVILKKPELKKGASKNYFELWQDAIKTGLYASYTFKSILNTGFTPDIILASAANGSIFGLPQIFPGSFLVNFLEDPGDADARFLRMRSILQAFQALQSRLAFSFAQKTRAMLPAYARKKIDPAPLAVDADFFSPAASRPFSCWKFASPRNRLITINLKNVHPARLQSCWKWILNLLATCPDCNLAALVGNSFIKKTLAVHAGNLEDSLRQRVFIEEIMRREAYRDLLASSSLCIFPEDCLSIAVLECMSCATPVMCDMAGNDFLAASRDYLPCVGENVHDLNKILNSGENLAAIGKNARKAVCAHYDMRRIYPGFFSGIIEKYRRWLAGSENFDK